MLSRREALLGVLLAPLVKPLVEMLPKRESWVLRVSGPLDTWRVGDCLEVRDSSNPNRDGYWTIRSRRRVVENAEFGTFRTEAVFERFGNG